MTINNEEDSGTPSMKTVCEILDKLTLKQLHLMEEKMRYELNIETGINNGSLHLAKTRYIMGQSTVSSARLPMESSPEFSASTVCETTEEDGVKQFKVIESDADNRANPLHWFGVLVPQNLRMAQSIFHHAINYVVDCVNVQLQLQDNFKNIRALKEYKSMLQS